MADWRAMIRSEPASDAPSAGPLPSTSASGCQRGALAPADAAPEPGPAETEGDLALAHDRLGEILIDPDVKPEARVSAARAILDAAPDDPVSALAERARETLREVLGPGSAASATAVVSAAKTIRDAAERARSPAGPTGEPGLSYVLAASEPGAAPDAARFPRLSRKVSWILADMEVEEQHAAGERAAKALSAAGEADEGADHEKAQSI